jgi:hypothetical protein
MNPNFSAAFLYSRQTAYKNVRLKNSKGSEQGRSATLFRGVIPGEARLSSAKGIFRMKNPG